MKRKNSLIILVILILIFVLLNKKKRYKKIIINYQTIESNKLNSDSEITKNKIIEPKKYYDSKFHSRNEMEINIPTRGEPPDYQQIGYLTGEGHENIKPLFGRQIYRGSNHWNYFTSLDSHLSTYIPVFMDDKDCTDERGCRELQKGDTISMGEGGNPYNASFYKTIVPRYIPY